jgi:mannose-6-phosphate isomerase-like protein (cupin superfamily)
MRRTLLAFLLTVSSNGLFAQTVQTPPATPQPATPKPATQKPAPKTATLVIQVTDLQGSPLGDTRVTVSGPIDRGGTTAPDGSLRLTSMRPGNYRLRFTHETSITFEREVTLRAGESLPVDVTLSPAPPPPEPPAPTPPPEPVKTLPPPGDPKVTPVPLFLEKNFIGGREGRKESSLGCSATGTATLHQLREAWLAHAHEDADEWIYVVAGEGTLRIGTSDNRLQAGVFSLVPRTASHAVIPSGRNPLIVISVLSGPQCKE